jgi:hypothetical protein
MLSRNERGPSINQKSINISHRLLFVDMGKKRPQECEQTCGFLENIKPQAPTWDPVVIFAGFIP